MGLFDSILGRSKPPEAALSLEVAGFTPTGSGSVCFRDVEGSADDVVLAEAEKLITTTPGATVTRSDDRFGFHWLTVARTGSDVSGLVTDLHAINSSLADAGFGASLLCSTIGLKATDGRALALVYLYKRGTFYPFAPLDGERRDNALELQIRGIVGDDVPVESDLARWLAIWGAPGLG